MKLNRFLLQLLAEHDLVIVPGFGAFVQEYKPAELSKDSDEIKPPSKKLTFNPQIKNNDGLLVGFVAEKSRCSNFEALQKIEKERDNWLYQLDKGERVVVAKIGTFYYDADRKVAFYSEEDRDLSLESFGLEATSLKEPEPVAPVEETAPIAAESNEPEEIESPQQAPVSETEPVVEPETIIEANRKPEPETEVEHAKTEVPAEKKSLETTAPVSLKKEEKKQKTVWWWLLLLLIPVIAVSVFFWQKGKQSSEPPVKKPLVQQEPETKNEPVTTIDTTTADTLAIGESDTLAKEEIEQPAVVDQSEQSCPKFYLVGGSFKSEENAETFLQQLKSQGFEASHLGKYGTYYIVGIGTFNSEEEALAAKDDYLDKSPGSGVWVLER